MYVPFQESSDGLWQIPLAFGFLKKFFKGIKKLNPRKIFKGVGNILGKTGLPVVSSVGDVLSAVSTKRTKVSDVIEVASETPLGQQVIGVIQEGGKGAVEKGVGAWFKKNWWIVAIMVLALVMLPYLLLRRRR